MGTAVEAVMPLADECSRKEVEVEGGWMKEDDGAKVEDREGVGLPTLLLRSSKAPKKGLVGLGAPSCEVLPRAARALAVRAPLLRPPPPLEDRLA